MLWEFTKEKYQNDRRGIKAHESEKRKGRGEYLMGLLLYKSHTRSLFIRLEYGLLSIVWIHRAFLAVPNARVVAAIEKKESNKIQDPVPSFRMNTSAINFYIRISTPVGAATIVLSSFSLLQLCGWTPTL